MSVPVSYDASLGPKMKALTPKQQSFVLNLLINGDNNITRAARGAGYVDHGNGSIQVTAFRLAHDEKVLAAIHEQADRRIKSNALMAAAVIEEIAMDPGHKDRLKAADRLLGGSGLQVATKHEVHVTITDEQKIQDIIALCKQGGLDPRTLLGNAGVELDKSEFKDITPAMSEAEADEMLSDLL